MKRVMKLKDFIKCLDFHDSVSTKDWKLIFPDSAKTTCSFPSQTSLIMLDNNYFPIANKTKQNRNKK